METLQNILIIVFGVLVVAYGRRVEKLINKIDSTTVDTYNHVTGEEL